MLLRIPRSSLEKIPCTTLKSFATSRLLPQQKPFSSNIQPGTGWVETLKQHKTLKRRWLLVPIETYDCTMWVVMPV